MVLRWGLVALAGLLLPLASTGSTAPLAGREPIRVMAAQPGQITRDRDALGGNPFASTLVALLQGPSLDLGSFLTALVEQTSKRTSGRQVPDLQIPTGAPTHWRWQANSHNETRRALVLVYWDYGQTGFASLPGARHDLARVSQALSAAGFRVEALANPDRSSLRTALSRFARESRAADAAVIYATGHGFQRSGQALLLPNDVHRRDGPTRGATRAIGVEDLARTLQARRVNVLFYGACRHDWPAAMQANQPVSGPEARTT